MRDHVTEERISAYVDGELEGDELNLVERLLAESAEYRQLFAELRELRASMQTLPNFDLPAGFHTRVVGQIDNLATSPSEEPVTRAGREPRAGPWRSVFFAAASLAAVVGFTVMLRPPTPTVDVPGPPDIRSTSRELPIYFREVPKYAMVYDVSVTPAGQKNKAVDQLLKKLEIGIDPALRLDGKLEEELLAIRESQRVLGATEATLYKNDQATPKSTEQDKVEMIYVAGTLGVLDQFGLDLQRMSDAGDEVSQLHYDMVIEPNKLGVMHRLHDSAREYFAQSTNIVPSDVGQAFRLKLTSVSVPGAATFPMPTDRAGSALSGRGRDARSFDVNRDGTANANDAHEVLSHLNGSAGNQDSNRGPGGAGRPNDGRMDPGHILLILRNVGANAGEAK